MAGLLGENLADGLMAAWSDGPAREEDGPRHYPELAIGGVQETQDPAADLRGVPREPLLRDMMTATHRFVLGLCNDEIGYMVPAAQWDEASPFAYGRDRPQYGAERSAGPRTAPTIMQALAGLFR